MTVNRVHRLGGLAVVFSLALATAGVAYAQESQQDVPTNAGIVVGEIDRCKDGSQTPAVGVSVSVDGGPSTLVKTDSGGEFSINVAAGTHTVVATADDGASATRGYVPVEAGSAIDVGILQLGGGAGGCGTTDANVTAPVLPTFTPTATLVPTLEPTPVPPTATPVPPTATPEATSLPEEQPAEDQPVEPESGG